MEKRIIAAVSDNNVIGLKGKMPWPHIPVDMNHFKRLTLGNYVAMGRRTYYSIGKPLKGRTNIVFTKDGEIMDDGIITCHSIEKALEKADSGIIYFIGGGEIYEQTLNLVDRLDFTRVHQNVRGDTYFPKINWNEWEPISKQDFPSQDDETPSFSFESYVRI
jgi:dihydrofolate reductase